MKSIRPYKEDKEEMARTRKEEKKSNKSEVSCKYFFCFLFLNLKKIMHFNILLKLTFFFLEIAETKEEKQWIRHCKP